MRPFPVVLLAGALLGGDCRGAPDRAAPPEARWPERPVRLIVPLGAGTGPDLVARLFAPRLASAWGRPVVVENRPGADMIAGLAVFATARDRHTLLFAPGAPLTLNPLVHRALPYDPQRDVVPIAAAVEVTVAVAASPALGVESLDDLVRVARANPGRFHWAGAPGPPDHLFAAFLRAHGLRMARVPYTELAAAVTDFGEGRLQVIVTSLSTLAPVRRTGRARVLAVLSRARSPTAPGVPTAAEAGFAELALEGVFGFFGWRGMPEELRRRIARDVAAAARDPALAARLASMGLTPQGGTPEAFGATLARQRASLEAVILGSPARTTH